MKCLISSSANRRARVKLRCHVVDIASNAATDEDTWRSGAATLKTDMTTSSVSFNDETQPGLSSVWSWWCESGRAAVGQTEVSPNGKALDVTTLTGQDWWRKPGHDACNGPSMHLR